MTEPHVMTGAQLDTLSRSGRALPADHTAFRDYLRTAYETDVLPRKAEDTLYSKAYEMGHADGYGYVEHMYGELADVALPTFRAVVLDRHLDGS